MLKGWGEITKCPVKDSIILPKVLKRQTPEIEGNSHAILSLTKWTFQ